jgi:type I restriction-modification system DNA methylase subunit
MSLSPTEPPQSPRSFLDEAYRSLGYSNGSLLNATSLPVPDSLESREWLEKGDWLALAKKAGAEKVFFLNNEPVIVFCEFHNSDDSEGLINVFRQAWCLSRPTCLFLALPGELRVYSLNQPPAKNLSEWKAMTPLAIVRRAVDVANRLNAFRREEIESGRLFSEVHFGSIGERADRRLIQDLKNVRKTLLLNGLPARYAHSLIGRSIFVRYLEDRGVLSAEYFERLAATTPQWQSLLTSEFVNPELSSPLKLKHYHKILGSKEFTYALFNQLAKDFNGDLFPRDSDEERLVNEERHLVPLQRFLRGDGSPDQPKLFFWAYDFEIVPVELISSIYEEFYHDTASVSDDKGTHYTPSVLVEFLLSRLLTPERLFTKPRILDPACGSGIFLVEAFRRIVRYEVQSNGGMMLSSEQLRTILRKQILGIELNTEATNIAAFSLYLALLHYQDPPNILKHKRLPFLISKTDSEADGEHLNVLHNANAFNLTSLEVEALRHRLEEKGIFSGRSEVVRLLNENRVLDVDLYASDIVVGNPPWEEATTTSTNGYRNESQIALGWARVFGHGVGDNSFSQLFIHRALSLVKPDGCIGLLVHSSVIYNQRNTSKEFRSEWLSHSKLKEVINFAHVRRLFFDKAVAPFIFVHFAPKKESIIDWRFVYASARHTAAAEQLKAVILTNSDRRTIRQAEIENRDYLWKTYWWGSHRDAALIAGLDTEMKLQDVLDEDNVAPGYGFQFGDSPPSESLAALPSLNSRRLQFYGRLRQEWFEPPPAGVKRQPDERLYRGQRLLVVRGIKSFHGLIARLENESFSFRHTIYCVPIPNLPEWKAKLILGVFWSSMGRYRMFMTSGTWGTWYDQTVPSDILSMPVRIPDQQDKRVQRVIGEVDRLRSFSPEQQALFDDSWNVLSKHLSALDSAIFDLFGLTEPQRHLIEDFFRYQYDLLVKGPASIALEPTSDHLATNSGTAGSLGEMPKQSAELVVYLREFLRIWNRELEPDGEFNWRIIKPSNVPMIAAVFTTQEMGSIPDYSRTNDNEEWNWVLRECESALLYPVSARAYLDGVIRVVTDTFIVIIKRDEKWLWTATSASEDAEATLLQAIKLQEKTYE